MSTFRVPVTRIDEIVEHPNADRLEIARIRGWRAIVGKGLHRAGDLVVYVPEGALVPSDVLRSIDLEGKLAGKDKNRVRAIRLRGIVSQGLVISLDIAEQHVIDGSTLSEGMDAASALGIEKYEEPIPIELRGKAMPWPEWVPRYTDIEDIKNYPDVLKDGQDVVIHEKLHGACSAFALSLEEPERLYVFSHRRCLIEDENNVFWRIAKKYKIQERLRDLLERTHFYQGVIYGEVLGVQDLRYGFENGHVGFRYFDVMLDGMYQDVRSNADKILTSIGLEKVPMLYYGPYSREIVDEHTGGKTAMPGADHMREGVVIRPVQERYDFDLGRIILKSRSEEYLTRHGGTELH